MLIEAINKDDN